MHGAMAKMHPVLAGYFDLHKSIGEVAPPAEFWGILDGTDGYDCDTLAHLLVLEANLLGVTGMSIAYAHASTNSAFGDYESRDCAVHGQERLGCWSGGYNRYEACVRLVVGADIEFYPAGFSHSYASLRDVIVSWLGANDPNGQDPKYQAWFWNDNVTLKACTNPGPYPVPIPNP